MNVGDRTNPFGEDNPAGDALWAAMMRESSIADTISTDPATDAITVSHELIRPMFVGLDLDPAQLADLARAVVLSRWEAWRRERLPWTTVAVGIFYVAWVAGELHADQRHARDAQDAYHAGYGNGHGVGYRQGRRDESDGSYGETP